MILIESLFADKLSAQGGSLTLTIFYVLVDKVIIALLKGYKKIARQAQYVMYKTTGSEKNVWRTLHIFNIADTFSKSNI